MSFASTELDIVRWAEARRIVPNATPRAQLVKTLEELAELVKADLNDDAPEIIDGVGDVAVTLIIYCALRDIDFLGCLEAAYQQIKNRKGTLTPAGIFVKES